MQDVEYYLEHFDAPDFCFSPDAEFPVCNGEKGVYSADLISDVLNGNIVAFEGGVASNAVPDLAHCVIKADAAALPAADRITVSDAGNGLARIEAKGKAGHAASPAGTINAIGLVVDYLLDNGLCTERKTNTCACCASSLPPPTAAPSALPATTACSIPSPSSAAPSAWRKAG